MERTVRMIQLSWWYNFEPITFRPITELLFRGHVVNSTRLYQACSFRWLFRELRGGGGYHDHTLHTGSPLNVPILRTKMCLSIWPLSQLSSEVTAPPFIITAVIVNESKFPIPKPSEDSAILNSSRIWWYFQNHWTNLCEAINPSPKYTFVNN